MAAAKRSRRPTELQRPSVGERQEAGGKNEAGGKPKRPKQAQRKKRSEEVARSRMLQRQAGAAETQEVGGKCEKGAAGCSKNGKFEGEFFGE